MPRKLAGRITDERYNHLYCLHELQIDPRAREIYLTGEPGIEGQELDEPGVEYRMATRFIKNLRTLQLESNEPILIHMKTCGGDESEGFAVYDAIRFCPCHVTILSYTHARSMSSIILQAADHRVLMPNSYFLIHWGTALLQGEFQAVMSQAAFDRRREDRFLNVYLDQMEKSTIFSPAHRSREGLESFLRDEMGRQVDLILIPDEAIKWNLADEVFAGDWAGLK